MPPRAPTCQSKPGGLFAGVTISPDDMPELIPLLEPEPIESFDAESGPAQVEEVFGTVEMDRWGPAGALVRIA